jgi:hypothetical protein
MKARLILGNIYTYRRSWIGLVNAFLLKEKKSVMKGKGRGNADAKLFISQIRNV